MPSDPPVYEPPEPVPTPPRDEPDPGDVPLKEPPPAEPPIRDPQTPPPAGDPPKTGLEPARVPPLVRDTDLFTNPAATAEPPTAGRQRDARSNRWRHWSRRSDLRGNTFDRLGAPREPSSNSARYAVRHPRPATQVDIRHRSSPTHGKASVRSIDTRRLSTGQPRRENNPSIGRCNDILDRRDQQRPTPERACARKKTKGGPVAERSRSARCRVGRTEGRVSHTATSLATMRRQAPHTGARLTSLCG